MKSALLIFLSAIFFLTESCVTLYKPDMINSPNLNERGEFTGSMGMGFLGTGLLNFQGAYALNGRVGVMGTIMYHGKTAVDPDVGFMRHSQFFSEAGAGYFKILDRRKQQLFQAYAGAGLGNTYNHYSNPDSIHISAQFTYHTIFLQGGYVFSPKYFDVAGDMRINYVNFFGMYSSSYELNTTPQYYVNVEPAITIRAGRKFRTFFQTGITYPLVNSKSYFQYNTVDGKKIGSLFKFSAGFNITLRVNKSNHQKWLRWRN